MIQLKSITVAFSLLFLHSAITDAAELRSNSGKRKVVRKMSYDFQEGPAREGEVIIESGDLDGVIGGPGCDSCSGDGCCSACLPCCFDLSGTWIKAEYLLWWREGSPSPALVTSSPDGTAQAAAGINPATILFGGQTIGKDAKPGGRITIGRWLDPCQIYSVEARFYSLGDLRTRFVTDSNENGIIARPFFNTDPAVQGRDAELIAFNGGAAPTTGSVDVDFQSEVSGADVYFRRLWCKSPCFRVDMLAGYQLSRIDESIRFDSFTDNGAGVTLAVEDLFATENEFHGGTLGLQAQFRRGCWTMDVMGKIGLGRMSQRVAIRGQRVTDAGGVVAAFDSGLLAQSLTGNTGVFEQSDFNFVPEVGINFAYAITPCLKINFGASLIYWDSVVQPMDQIDFSVDGRLLNSPNGPIIPPQPTNPQFNFNPSEYYVHGINAGLEYRF